MYKEHRSLTSTRTFSFRFYCDFQKHANSSQVNGYNKIRFRCRQSSLWRQPTNLENRNKKKTKKMERNGRTTGRTAGRKSSCTNADFNLTQDIRTFMQNSYQNCSFSTTLTKEPRAAITFLLALKIKLKKIYIKKLENRKQ